ncbi:MAG: YggS family pyridoxal phosphate-dependent enzyme [Ruminococcaceae bacterium]|nr:YggS family pyridoxal phosphate-dependent enzyme [Oscillospiraceae bacterium]
MSITENVAKVLSDIEQAAIAAGRDPRQITLCAATKMNDAQNVREAIAAGVRCCGENRVQELTAKLAENAYEGADLHFIGHLQTNKVKQVVGKVSLIQSVDSLRLLEAIEKEAAKQGIRQDILLEINIGEESSKSGLHREEIYQMLEKVAQSTAVRVRGLMAIPPICQNPGDNNKFFAEMCNLSVDITEKKYDNVCMEILSMGMSDDYADAIAHGSTMIRVGTAIFGARNYGV